MNNGILTTKRKVIKLPARRSVIQVPLWQTVLVCLAVGLVASSFTYSLRSEPKIVIERVPVPTCAPLSKLDKPRYKVLASELSGALPMSALTRRGK